MVIEKYTEDCVAVDKNFSKHVVTQMDLDLICQIFSNHPRRASLQDPTYIENREIPNLFDLNRLNKFNDTLNIIVGDSHAEFLGRLFKEIMDEVNAEEKLNRTYCFWTGATTLIGSIQSEIYFSNMLRSLAIIIEALRKKISFSRLNIILSYGEIDIRTKLFLECFTKKLSYEEVVLKYCTEPLVKKLDLLKVGLNSLFATCQITIYFKSPPPPSNLLGIRTPTSRAELMKVLKAEPYPAFLEAEERLSRYKFFKRIIKASCLMSGIEFLKGFSENDELLGSQNSFDGVHISHGDWAVKNSRQIFLEI